MKEKASPSVKRPARRRSASGKAACSRRISWARIPLAFAGERRKMRGMGVVARVETSGALLATCSSEAKRSVRAGALWAANLLADLFLLGFLRWERRAFRDFCGTQES